MRRPELSAGVGPRARNQPHQQSSDSYRCLQPTLLRAERKEGGVGDLNYSLVSDLKREISQKYGVLSSDGVALRGLFLVDREVCRWGPNVHKFSPCFPPSYAHSYRAAFTRDRAAFTREHVADTLLFLACSME